MSDNAKPTDAATEQAEIEELRTLLRRRLLAILRSDQPVRASMLAQVVKLLAEMDKLKPIEPTASAAIPGSALSAALAQPFDLPFPGKAKLPGGRLNDADEN
jgi:hypothetical protein